MNTLPNLVSHLALVAQPYLTLLRLHPTKKYTYASRTKPGAPVRQHPVIEFELHESKCKEGESWMYFAIPASTPISAIAPEDRLYVGAQTQDRMFRGDRLNGTNFHHAEMRSGNGAENLEAFLASGKSVMVYRAAAQQIAKLLTTVPELDSLRTLCEQPTSPRKHLGWWLEQYVLHAESKQWRWNTCPADKLVVKLFPV